MENKIISHFMDLNQGPTSQFFPPRLLYLPWQKILHLLQIYVKSINVSDYMEPEVYGHMNRRKVKLHTSKASNYMRFYLHRWVNIWLHFPKTCFTTLPFAIILSSLTVITVCFIPCKWPNTAIVSVLLQCSLPLPTQAFTKTCPSCAISGCWYCGCWRCRKSLGFDCRT